MRWEIRELGKVSPEYCVLIRCVKLKRLPDERASFGVNVYSLCSAVVQVSDRGKAGPYPFSKFLPVSPLDVLRKVVYVILALPEGDAEHELALRGVFKPEGGDFRDLSLPVSKRYRKKKGDRSIFAPRPTWQGWISFILRQALDGKTTPHLHPLPLRG